MQSNGASLVVEGLKAWGVDTIFGLPGDGINGVMEAIRETSGVRFIQVRHEESAALAACAHAKWTGRLGCCLATTGPGGIHLLNGLYDAKLDCAPVVAVTGLPYHDLVDTFTQQDVNHGRLFADVAVYSASITSAQHVENAVTLACRSALEDASVAHLAISVDVQEETLEDTPSSPGNIPHHASPAKTECRIMPSEIDMQRAVEILATGRRIAILAGRGALGATQELLELAERLGAPIIKALRGKCVVPDSHQLTTGGVGLLGTRPSQEALEECDTLLIVGSTFPYVEYYPRPGHARGVQIDHDAARIGLRFPVEVGLVGDARPTLALLNERVAIKTDRTFLTHIQHGSAQWRKLLSESALASGPALSGARLAHELGERLKDDAIVSWDCGQNTGVLARYVQARQGQMFEGSGLLATMACSLPYAIAAQLAYPERQVVAFTGDGGLSMLLGELATLTRYRLPVKVIVMKNNTLGQIKWEQMLFLGNPEYECDLQPIDFCQVAMGMRLQSFRTDTAAGCAQALDAVLAHPGPALLEATVDPHEPLLPPKRMPHHAENLEKALASGTAGAEEIRAALKKEPARTMMH